MPINRERIAGLAGYGLTEYQARVYLALLDYGPLKASQLPPVSGVPRTRIYVTIQQLHGKGLVRIRPEHPLRFEGVPFDAFLHTLAGDYARRAEYITTHVDKISEEFRPSRHAPPEAPGRLEAIYGRKNARERVLRMYEAATTEIIGVGSVAGPSRIARAYGRVLGEKAAAGVSIKFAFFETPSNREAIRTLGRYAEIRDLGFELPVTLHGVDGRQFCMLRPNPDDESFSRGGDVAFWTDDAMIAQAMALIARRIWQMGRPTSIQSAPAAAREDGTRSVLSLKGTAPRSDADAAFADDDAA